MFLHDCFDSEELLDVAAEELLCVSVEELLDVSAEVTRRGGGEVPRSGAFPSLLSDMAALLNRKYRMLTSARVQNFAHAHIQTRLIDVSTTQ